jgi:hypothetical protein
MVRRDRTLWWDGNRDGDSSRIVLDDTTVLYRENIPEIPGGRIWNTVPANDQMLTPWSFARTARLRKDDVRKPSHGAYSIFDFGVA